MKRSCLETLRDDDDVGAKAKASSGNTTTGHRAIGQTRSQKASEASEEINKGVVMATGYCRLAAFAYRNAKSALHKL